MSQNRNVRIMLAGGALIVLVLLVSVVFLNRGSGAASAQSVRQASVIVAVQTIPQGTTFRAGQPLGTYFAVRQLPTSLVPFGAYTSLTQIDNLLKSTGCAPANSTDCQGQVTTTQTIYQNLPVVSGMFSTLGAYRSTRSHAFDIPYGYVAIAVSFSDVNSVLNSVEPGDTVDLMASYLGKSADIPKSTPGQTQFVLNDLKVIGVGGPPSNVAGTTTSAPAPNAGGSLLLLVRFQQALEIQHLKDFGWALSVVLRSARETQIPHFKTLPITDRWFFNKISNHMSVHNPY